MGEGGIIWADGPACLLPFGRDEFISKGAVTQLPTVGRRLGALHRQGSEKKEGGARRWVTPREKKEGRGPEFPPEHR